MQAGGAASSQKALCFLQFCSFCSFHLLHPLLHLLSHLLQIHLPSHQKMPGTLPRFPTVPAMLGSLPRAVNPPSLPRGLTMPSLPGLPSLPSMPRCVLLPRPAVMSTVSAAPRRLLQDCCSVLDHQSAAGNSKGGSRLVQPFPLFKSKLLLELLNKSAFIYSIWGIFALSQQHVQN